MIPLNRLILEAAAVNRGDPKRISHLIKVHAFARLIGEEERLDDAALETLELAAVLHDIGIRRSEEIHGSADGSFQELEGPPIAARLLDQYGVPKATADRACWLVGHHHTYDLPRESDYQILVEADFLVNLQEDGAPASAVRAAEQKIFRTRTGLSLLRTMFPPQGV